MLTIEDLLWRPEASAPDESTDEGRADALVLSGNTDDAALLYEKIPARPRRVREKLAWCRSGEYASYSAEILGDVENTTSVGLRMQAKAACAGGDLTAFDEIITYVTKPGPFNPAALTAFGYAMRWFAKPQLAETIVERLISYVTEHTNSDQLGLVLRLTAAVRNEKRDVIPVLLAQADLKTIPLLAPVFRAAMAIARRDIARDAVLALIKRHPSDSKLANTVGICAMYLRDWTILDSLEADPAYDVESQYAFGIARAVDAGDSASLAALLIASNGTAQTTGSSVIREGHTMHMEGCYVDCWPSMEIITDRVRQIADLAPPSQALSRFIYDAWVMGEFQDEELNQYATLAYKNWPSFETLGLLEAAGQKIAPKDKARLVVDYIDRSIIDNSGAYLLSEDFSLPEGKKDLKAFLDALEVELKDIPPMRRPAATWTVYDKILDPNWKELFDQKFGTYIRTVLHYLCFTAGMASEYACNLAFAHFNLGERAEARAALDLCDEPAHEDEGYIYLEARLALESDRYILVARSKQIIESLPNDHKALSKRVKDLLPSLTQSAITLAGTVIHTPTSAAPPSSPVPASLSLEVLGAMETLASALEGSNVSELLTLQTWILKLTESINDILPLGSGDKVVYQAWESRHAGSALGPKGEQLLQGAAKTHGHARVILSMDEQVVKTAADPDEAMGALQKVLAQRSAKGSNRLAYLSGILRNRLSYLNSQQLNRDVKFAANCGIDVETLIAQAKETDTWTEWRNYIDELGS